MIARGSSRSSENEMDLKIIARIRGGETDAFAELVERYKAPVWSLVNRYLGSNRQVQDVCQEVFLNLWKALPGFEGRSKFFTWFYRLIMNTCHNHIRGQSLNEVSLSVGDKMFDIIDIKDNPLRCAEKKDLAEKINGALEKLPPDMREALILRETQGLSYSEIAEVLSISEGTVKSRIHNARITLGGLLAGKI